MIVEKVKWVGLAVIALGTTLAGAAVMARQPGASVPKQSGAVNRPKSPAKNSELVDNRLNPSDSESTSGPAEVSTLPDSERAELEDLRSRLIQAAKRDWTSALEDFRMNKAPLDRIYQASLRLMAAEEDGKASAADQAAVSAHAERMRDVARIQHGNPSRAPSQVSLVDAFSAEADLWRAQAAANFRTKGKSLVTKRVDTAGSGSSDAAGRGDGGAPTASTGPRQGQDPRSRLIIGKLEEPVAMKFTDETPIEDVLKHIRDSTKSSDMPSGIPIYVDPIGLSEADKTMASPIRMELEGVPLRRTLQLALAQLGLGYCIVDGMLYITSQESVDGSLPPAMPTPSPHMLQVEKAERGELTLEEMKDLVEKLKMQKQIQGLQRVESVWGGEGTPPNTQSPEEVKQNKELIESLSKLSQSLLEELKELRKTKPAEKADSAAPAKKANSNLQ